MKTLLDYKKAGYHYLIRRHIALDILIELDGGAYDIDMWGMFCVIRAEVLLYQQVYEHRLNINREPVVDIDIPYSEISCCRFQSPAVPRQRLVDELSKFNKQLLEADVEPFLAPPDKFPKVIKLKYE